MSLINFTFILVQFHLGYLVLFNLGIQSLRILKYRPTWADQSGCPSQDY
jgi:hypothetical protein